MTSSGGGRFMAYSPSPSAPHSPHIPSLRSAAAAAASAALLDQEKLLMLLDTKQLRPRYLNELLAERHKLNPFLPVLPHTYRLLSQEIMRVTTLLGNASVLGQSGLEHASPLTSGGIFSNGGADMNGLASRFQSEVRILTINITYNATFSMTAGAAGWSNDLQISSLVQPTSAQNWLSSQGSSSGLIVKRTIRVDIPVDQFPSYNFVGRLLGPRGNSLKRVEASTECRVLIRGRGSIKDPARDETHDFYKKQQLRELAMLNGTLREEGSPMSGSVSPFHNSLGMKRAKTRG
ncbi:hypothetical protein Patl1_03695 [Pistacia atlantica]|uniref:Uncharacterized protein n=1 Tax=Pistacia atlantica TaxID=434234 RepID=A0ACC1BSU8_9ROSI|nr:hypothetical protein Patl1_03695 [Pistacia atlantica]